MKSQCYICGVEVSRLADSIAEFLCWESPLGYLTKKATGRVAHLSCFRGEPYNERQMTITDVIQEQGEKE